MSRGSSGRTAPGSPRRCDSFSASTRPTRASVLVGGKRYRDLRAPLCEVGALLDAGATHPGRRARSHLLWLARSNRLPAHRVDEVLELVGLSGGRTASASGASLWEWLSGWASQLRCSATRRC